MADNSKRIAVGSLGLAVGITWGLGVLLMGILGTIGHMGLMLINVLGSAYVGYEPTYLGSLIGAAWAFVDGFICGVLIAFFYNLFAPK